MNNKVCKIVSNVESHIIDEVQQLSNEEYDLVMCKLHSFIGRSMYSGYSEDLRNNIDSREYQIHNPGC
jgi:hypothetical protein